MQPLSSAAARSLDAAERHDRAALRRTLTEHRGNVRAVALALGVSTDTVHRRIRAYDLAAWHHDTFPRSGRQPKKDRGGA